MKFLYGLVVSFLLSLTVISTVQAQTLRAATLHFPPYSYENENQKADGISVQTVRKLAARLGMEVEVEVYPWARALELVRKGSVDMLFTAYKTPAREKFLYYSAVPLIVQKVSLFVNSSSHLNSLEDITLGKASTTATRRKVSYGPVIDNLIKQNQLVNSFTGNDDIHLLELLKGKRVDTVPLSQFVAYHNIRKAGLENDIREIQPPVQSVPSYLTFSKALDHKKLATQFSVELIKMRKDGSIQKILDQWLAQNRL
ncbi:conserved exported hypothetical protein [Candidatus Terasakiella magnetica]|uniref:Solute-binding protein family 3/N-terminal domain-containing protein n=1 Tax=Candidatus Terasakiella magnetica TaxID=1867952 RepID=A0A1C3RK41_9PROT|nr:transporter substrate-binding domain-containing protein [Candidatus Terasakiella magnetica]SCA57611.1 conserved exported hypothetical protein [Candidatus Terasakiella magnetica]